MPRKSRGQLVGKLENRLNEERSEELRELARQLRREQRQQRAAEYGELASACEEERDGQHGSGEHQ